MTSLFCLDEFLKPMRNASKDIELLPMVQVGRKGLCLCLSPCPCLCVHARLRLVSACVCHVGSHLMLAHSLQPPCWPPPASTAPSQMANDVLLYNLEHFGWTVKTYKDAAIQWSEWIDGWLFYPQLASKVGGQGDYKALLNLLNLWADEMVR
jgi:hypothetical protein